jgi:peptidoglycan/LPS O-acetylase OafA/YrhL
MTTGSTTQPDEHLLFSEDQAGTAPEDRKFRPDVQGLRAVAVILVVLFHAHVPGLSGGYVGVDVFFVISGFVITGVLLRERESSGSTSIRKFYGRRVRRILPAATLVIIAAVVLSYVLLGPLDGNQTASDARWASVFLLNVHFATNGTNYLASQLPPSVLQNYWSLAVEEQFYLVYPAVFLILAGFSSRVSLRVRLGVVLSAVVIISFVASVVQTSNNATAAYFSPLPRVWELALGGLIAVSTVHLRRLPPLIASMSSWLGLTAILVAAFVFSSSTAYPGWAVAVPVIGTGLVIGGGVATSAHGAERLLGLRPFQLIGLVSYSLYLWHWPVLTLATERSGAGSLTTAQALLWVLVSLGLAILTYVLIENPVRHSALLVPRQWASLVLGACLIGASLTVATVGLRLHNTGTLATPGLAGLSTGDACPSPTPQEVSSLTGKGAGVNHRIVARILLVGDSTACTMLPGLEAVADPAGVRVEDGAVIGCGVVSGNVVANSVTGSGTGAGAGADVGVNSASRSCQRQASVVEQRALRSGNPKVVLWSSTWERAALIVGRGAGQRVLVQGSPQWYSVLRNRMEVRLRQFTARGATVVLLTQPPFFDGANVTRPTGKDRDFERLNALLADVAARVPHVRVVNLASYVCPSGPPCPLGVDNVWVRADGAHYSTQGSLWVARWLMPQLGIGALRKPVNPLPVMNVVGLSKGQILKGTKGIAAVSSFNLGGFRVEFQVTGSSRRSAVIGTAVFVDGLWGLRWNTHDVPSGTYVLRSIAFDSAGRRSVSKGIAIRVAN